MATLGSNINLVPRDVEQALKRRALDILRGRGKSFDDLELMNRMTIHLRLSTLGGAAPTIDPTTGAHNIQIDAVMATWEE
jgi:hypothetical protein